MQKDRSEQRGYRRSPGRQYGYEEDDALYHRREQSQRRYASNAGRDEFWSSHGATRPDTALLQRPDLRRTRQLMRQSIIASKRPVNDEVEPPEQQEAGYEEMTGEQLPRYPQQSGRAVDPRLPLTRDLAPEMQVDPQEYDDVDPDPGYYEEDLAYAERPIPPVARAGRRTPIPPRASGRRTRPIDIDYDDGYDEEDEEPPRRRRKKRKMSRRKLLAGIGVVAVGGAAFAAYEVAPHVPQALDNVGTNIEHQLQEAFDRGVAQGANQVRKEFVTALEDLEGFTLQGAIAAAKLTRVAYDVFVSPIVQVGATITGDFLGALLKALEVGRAWLARVYQDNATLAALQTVLQSWVNQVSNMPKQLNAITQTDLDGAQAYLRALQRKLDQEKALLNGQQPASTPTAQPTPKK